MTAICYTGMDSVRREIKNPQEIKTILDKDGHLSISKKGILTKNIMTPFFCDGDLIVDKIVG